MSSTTEVFDDPTRQYGAKVAAIEPGGAEFIPLDERHGKPRQLLWTWTSPNMEFATVTVGLLGPVAFGMNFWQSVSAIVVGTLLGAIALGVLSAWGPRHGFAQMVIGRSAFGFLGNILPAGLNTLVAGIGWFAVDSVSGALALNALIPALPKSLCLVIMVLIQLVVAFFGHNLIQAFEKYAFPVLTVVFVVSASIVLSKAHPHVAATYSGGIGGWLIMVASCFGYAAGWAPYGSDYTRYLAKDTPRKPIGLYAALGLIWSCLLLETAGAAIFTAGKSAIDPSSFSGLLPTWLGDLTLLAICLGAMSANVLNVYSGSLSFLSLGIKIKAHLARAIVVVVFCAVGLLVSLPAINNAGTDYENFLLIISYWLGPWLAIVFIDRIRRRGTDVQSLLVNRKHESWAAPITMAIATGVSIWLFSDQTEYVGPLPKSHPALGDLTFESGFVIAALLYLVLLAVLPSKTKTQPAGEVTSASPAAEVTGMASE